MGTNDPSIFFERADGFSDASWSAQAENVPSLAAQGKQSTNLAFLLTFSPTLTGPSFNFDLSTFLDSVLVEQYQLTWSNQQWQISKCAIPESGAGALLLTMLLGAAGLLRKLQTRS
jgi:hypothetical protein